MLWPSANEEKQSRFVRSRPFVQTSLLGFGLCDCGNGAHWNAAAFQALSKNHDSCKQRKSTHKPFGFLALYSNREPRRFDYVFLSGNHIVLAT